MYRGQVLTWFATISDIPTEWGRSKGFRPSSRSILLACSVTGDTQRGYAVSRRVRSFLVEQPHTPVLEHPAIIVKGTQAFKADGTPLNTDPICLFYSPEMYGDPPAKIEVGTTWRYRRPLSFGFLGGLQVVTGVTKLDVQKNLVTLHIATNYGGSATLIDMTIAAGGLIETEVDRSDSFWRSRAFPNTIDHPTEITSWAIQHRTLAGLWAYPPSDPVPFNLQNPPDIFNPNGRFISVWRLPIGSGITLVRIWHFGPFALENILAIWPNHRDVFLTRDVLLILGSVLLVLLLGRAVMMALQMRSAQTVASPPLKRRLMALQVVLALLAAVSLLWWIYS